MTNVTNIFEEATRNRIRYESSKGLLSVEDLWSLPLTSKVNAPNLNDIARNLYSELKNITDNISFVPEVNEKKTTDKTQLAFNVVKHIIDVKVAERDKEAELRANKEKKEKILAKIAEKEDAKFDNMDLEELKKIAQTL